MRARRRRRSDRAGRLPMRSPSRPPAGRREHRKRFWEAIARGYRARMQGSPPVCRPRSARDGSARTAGCHHATWSRFRGAICRSPNEKRSRSCTLRASGSARSRGGSADVQQRSRGNCVETLQPVMGTCSIEPQQPSGTPTDAPDVRRSRSSSRTTDCADMSRTGSQASSPPPTAPVYRDPMYAGSVGDTVGGRSDAGHIRGVPSRSLIGSESISPRVILMRISHEAIYQALYVRGRGGIVRRDTGEGYREYLRRLAQESGMEDPSPEDLQRFARKRKKKTSNEEWAHPSDPAARVARTEGWSDADGAQRGARGGSGERGARGGEGSGSGSGRYGDAGKSPSKGRSSAGGGECGATRCACGGLRQGVSQRCDDGGHEASGASVVCFGAASGPSALEAEGGQAARGVCEPASDARRARAPAEAAARRADGAFVCARL